MKVLHIMASGARGGGADHLEGILPALVRLGVDVTAIVGDDGPTADRLAARGIPVTTERLMHSRLDPRTVRRLSERARILKPSLVHTHGTRAAVYWALAKTMGLSRVPMIYTAHGLAYRQPAGILWGLALRGGEWLACHAANHVLAVAKADCDDLVASGFVSRECIGYLPNAVDLTRFVRQERSEARSKFDLDPDSFVVICVSRLVPQKAVADAISVAYLCPYITLLVVGGGPEEEALRARAAPAGNRIRFLGVRDDVPALLSAADVFLLTSRWEGEPIALIEAMAIGMPCVATATTGAAELLGDDCGRLAAVGDIEGLAEHLRELMHSPTERAEISRRAQAKVAARSHDANATLLRQLYMEILDRPSNEP